jgi:hypothetical protein
MNIGSADKMIRIVLGVVIAALGIDILRAGGILLL